MARTKICLNCKFRDYGTDSHYVCTYKVKRPEQGYFRVRQKDHCDKWRAK